MPGSSAEPPPPGRPPSDASDVEEPSIAEQRTGVQPERIGDLSIMRTVKDDGRALLLYSHDERDAT